MKKITNNSQINLKLPSKLVMVAEEYAEYHGYSNVQELIRDSLRQKVFSDEIREDYVNKLKELEVEGEFIGEEKSNELLLKLGEKAIEYKNAKR